MKHACLGLPPVEPQVAHSGDKYPLPGIMNELFKLGWGPAVAGATANPNATNTINNRPQCTCAEIPGYAEVQACTACLGLGKCRKQRDHHYCHQGCKRCVVCVGCHCPCRACGGPWDGYHGECHGGSDF